MIAYEQHPTVQYESAGISLCSALLADWEALSWDPALITLCAASDLHRAMCLDVAQVERQCKKDLDLSRSREEPQK